MVRCSHVLVVCTSWPDDSKSFALCQLWSVCSIVLVVAARSPLMLLLQLLSSSLCRHLQQLKTAIRMCSQSKVLIAHSNSALPNDMVDLHFVASTKGIRKLRHPAVLCIFASNIAAPLYASQPCSTFFSPWINMPTSISEISTIDCLFVK